MQKEAQMRFSPSVLIALSVFSVTGTCLGQATSPLTAASVQAAVNQAVAWTQTGGSITVVGVREVPGQNAAAADLQFNNFQYNADFMSVPKPKSERTPAGNPAVVYIPPSASRNFLNYSGQGVASMTHYTDGRWVLTRIDFNFVQITSSVPVLLSEGNFDRPTVVSTAVAQAGTPIDQSTARLSATFKTYQGSGFEISFPDNWNVKETSPGMTYYFGFEDRLRMTPITLGTGMVSGNFGTQITSLRPATERFVELMTAMNTDTKVQHEESVEVSGRQWYSVLIDAKSALSSEREAYWVVATQHPPGLFFIMFIAPTNSFDGLRPQFTRVLESVRVR
jgi:hypothetical protein